MVGAPSVCRPADPTPAPRRRQPRRLGDAHWTPTPGCQREIGGPCLDDHFLGCCGDTNLECLFDFAGIAVCAAHAAPPNEHWQRPDRRADEECDGADLAEMTCEDRGFKGGTLRCASDCSFDTSLCDTLVSAFLEPPRGLL
jgi:hypothetical protein